MDHPLTAWIDELKDGRTPSAAISTVITLLKNSPEIYAFATATSVAKAAGVNAGTVVRTAQFLGFSGWPDFALDYRGRYLASLSTGTVLGAAPQNTISGMPDTGSSEEDINSLTLMNETVDKQSISLTARTLLAANRTFVLSTGVYSGAASQLAYSCQLVGLDVQSQSGSASTQLSSVRLLNSDDLIIAFKLWRSSKIIDKLCLYGHELGVPQIVVTDRSSNITDLADITLMVPSSSSRLLPSTIPAVATVQSIINEIIFLGGDSVKKKYSELDALWQRFDIIDGA